MNIVASSIVAIKMNFLQNFSAWYTIDSTSSPNSTWGNAWTQSSQLGPLDIILLVCAVCGIIGNTLCVMVLLYHGPLRNKLHNLFLINHSLVDLVVCFLLIPDTLTANVTFSNVLGCYLWQSPTVFTGLYVSSVYNIVALAIERYMEVVRPIAHRNYVTRPRVIFLLVVIWLFGPAYRAVILSQDTRLTDGNCVFGTFLSPTGQKLLGSATIIMEFCVPLFVIVLCYGLMALSLRKRIKPSANAVTSASDIMSRAQSNVSMTLVLVTTCFVCCTILYQILILLDRTDIYQIDWSGTLFNTSVLLNNCSCAVYPYICFHRHTEFKRGLRALFHLQSEKSTVENEPRRATGSTEAQAGQAASALSSRH